MIPSFHSEILVHREQSVQVALNTPARIYLVDDKNYDRMRSHERFRYYGRSSRRDSILIRPDHPGMWHVVVTEAQRDDLAASVSLVS